MAYGFELETGQFAFEPLWSVENVLWHQLLETVGKSQSRDGLRRVRLRLGRVSLGLVTGTFCAVAAAI